MQSTVTAHAKWYDPTIWPNWLRWCATVVAPIIVAVVIYIIYNIINGVMESVPHAVTSLFAVLIAAYAFVVTGRVIAPNSQRFVGYTLALIVLVFIGYLIGVVVTNPASSTPQWYSVLFGLVAAGGAAFGALAELNTNNPTPFHEFYGWLPNAARWALFLPIGIVLSLVVNFGLGIPLDLLHLNSEAIKLVNTPLSMAVFIAVCAAVAPRRKDIVGLGIAILFGAFAVFGLFMTLDRPLAAQIFANKNLGEVVWATSVWYQTLSFSGVLGASIIGAAGAIAAERDRKSAASAT